ncbi:glycosyl transferase family 1 [Vibrio kanaloae]|uniref:glycosyltransferase family 4 protein n=2 Tax=Vibrio TaxID=662 RepID=UPI000C82FBF6|nr:glycosyltransferase family 4 protein [Vibrio kanaloae]KAB0460994.1 glycosyltransferase family 4 protein [Vibrio kanaloae]PMM01496.1 glycosyl transferase family 1 [Vibrio kanaloae]
MKILIASSYYHARNSVRPEAEMFIEMVKQGHEVTVLTQGDAEYAQRFQENGVRVVDAYPNKKICLKTIKAYKKELNNKSYDIFYAFNSKTIPNAAFACIGTKTKLITYRGTTGGLYRHDPSAYLTHLHPKVSGVVCVSKAVANDVKKRVWCNKDNVVTIYKGHELDWYTVQANKPEEFGLDSNKVVAVCAAHVRPSKGIDVLIRATHFVDNPDFHLLLIGSGYEPYFEMAKESPMSERIHFIGHRKDVPSIMAMADFQIQPSISGEGLPRTIVEAMANGTPSIVTTTGGSPELIEENETGYIVPVKNAQLLGDSINNMAKNKEHCAEMGRKAKIRLQRYFSSSETVKQHINFFEKLTKK